MTNEKQMANIIRNALEYENEDEGIESEVKSIHSFEDQMLLTRDEGLVIKLKDGSEFQVSITQSEESPEEETKEED